MAASPSGTIIPALLPPPGVTSNFVNPYNASKYTTTIVATLLPFATVVVWIRLYTRIRLVKSHGWDDYTSFIAWLGLIAYSIVKNKSKDCGSGIHQWDLPVQRIKDWAQWTSIQEMVYAPTISITKLSILLMYLRAFWPYRSIKTLIYYLTHFIIWFNMLFYLVVMIVIGCQCIPWRKKWNPSVPGKCVNFHAVLATNSIINLISDFSILLLPIQSIWGLQLSPKRKLALSAVFATGLVACVASTMRVYISVKNYTNPDITYTLALSGHWTYAEIVIGIVCGCMPVLPKFFGHVTPIFTQTLSYYCSKARGFFDRAFSRSGSSSCGESSARLPQDSKDHPGTTRGAKIGKKSLSLRSFSDDEIGLSTMIHADLPRTASSTPTFREQDQKSDDSQDLENQ